MLSVINAPILRTPQGRRRKRISISPKKPTFKPRISDPCPQSPTVARPEPHLEALERLELEFPHSYFDDEKKQFRMLSRDVSFKLLEVLRKRFPQVLNILPVAPFLVIECEGDVPDPSTTPFLIAGLIACFIIAGQGYPFGIDFIGEDGGALGLTEADVPASVWNDIKPFHIPQLATFEWIHKFIPHAEYVSSFPQQLVVELAQMQNEEFQNVLISLPDTIGCLNVGYVNGPILTKKFARQKAPQPLQSEGEYDDSDYLDLDNGGTLRPGLLLECAGYLDDEGMRRGICASNSGIKVCKDDKIRLTVAAHGWDAVQDKVVYHPTRHGHNIGNIVETIGEDIGLASLICPFTNEFPELQVKAKTLLHSSQLRYNQFAVIDSCFTGVQTLRVLGVRTGADSRLQGTDGQEPVPGPMQYGRYIKVCQGIYGVNAAVIPTQPQIRQGVCGTPLIVGGANKRKMTHVLGDGIVAGFMLWNDIEGRYNLDRQIYSFCQTTDPLIESGWSVCDEA